MQSSSGQMWAVLAADAASSDPIRRASEQQPTVAGAPTYCKGATSASSEGPPAFASQRQMCKECGGRGISLRVGTSRATHERSMRSRPRRACVPMQSWRWRAQRTASVYRAAQIQCECGTCAASGALCARRSHSFSCSRPPSLLRSQTSAEYRRVLQSTVSTRHPQYRPAGRLRR